MQNFKTQGRQKALMVAVLSLAFLVVAGGAFAALTFTATTTTSDGAYTLTAVDDLLLTLTSGTAAEDLTLSVTGATDSSLFLASSGTGADAMTLTTTAGGLDISVTGDLAGEDLDITTVGATTEMRLTSASTEADAIRILTSGTAGGIDVDTTDGAIAITAAGAANGDLTLTVGDDFTVNGAATSLYNIGAATTGGTIIIGGTAQTGLISLGDTASSTVTEISIGGGDGIKTAINIGDGAGANGINIGGAASNIVLTDAQWSVTGPGVGTLVNLLVSPSATTGVDVGSAGALSVGRVNATSVVIGSAATTAITLTTDATGDGTDVVLPAQSVNGSEMLNNTVTETQLAAAITFADADNVSFASVSVTAAGEGLVLPLHATDCTTANASVIVDGQVCWESDANTLYIGDGDNFAAIPSSLGSANTWTTTNTFTPATNVSGIALVGTNVTTGTLATVTSTALTTGGALSVTATNTAVADTAAGISPVLLAVTNAQGTAAQTSGGGFSGLRVNFTNAPTIAANTENMVMIQNQATTNATDNAVAAGLLIDNADTSATGSTVITDALRITNSGAIAGGITNAINIASTTVTTDLSLQNGLTVSNDVNNELALVENSLTLNLDFGEVASTVKAESASALELESTANVTGAIVIDSTVGGINITASGAAATEDITVVATGSSVGITATESINDAIRITASGANGAIVLAAGEATAAGTNATVSIISETIFDNTANVAFAAQTVLTTAATLTLTPTSSYVNAQCNRAAAADTVTTLDETGAADGQLLIVVVDDTNNAGTCSFTDSAGVQATAGTATLDDLDSIVFIYKGGATAQWVQLTTSNN